MDATVIRQLEERDVERAGDVNFVAFHDAALRHGAAPTVTTPGDCRSYVRHLLGFDGLGGLVAEVDGDVVGMAWVHPRGPVSTVGPIAVDPSLQGRGIGRRLLERCLDVVGRTSQVRLVQESYNTTSLGLYLRSGFRVVAPLLELELPAGGQPVVPPVPAPLSVREATAADRARLVDRDARAFGAPRPQNVDLYLHRGRTLVAERGTALAGFAFGIGFRGHGYLGSAAAEDPELLLAMLGQLAAGWSPRRLRLRILVPATDRRLVDGLAAIGFRVAKACLYMVRGGGTAPPANYVLMNGDMM